MKTKLLILAIAGLTLASCSSDETVALNPNNAISFRALNDGVTRAVAKTSWTTGDVINVFAEYKVGEASATKYFQADFTKQDASTFTSGTIKYYWPAMTGNKMIFSAFYGAVQNTTTAGTLASSFSPAANAADQVDLMFARHEVSNAAEAPVVLNFRHMLSQIDVQVKNSNSGLKFNVTGVRIGYVKNTATAFTGDFTTDTKDAAKIAAAKWTVSAFPTEGDAVYTIANGYKYDVTSLNFDVAATQSTATSITGFSPWMLLPQTITKATAYTRQKESGSSAGDPELNGAYIAICMSVYNNDGASTPIIANQWCYWPITNITWNPGYKYTYVVDLAGGGYNPQDTNNDNTDLEPILGSPIEMSASCTIDSWSDYDSNTTTDGTQPIDIP